MKGQMIWIGAVVFLAIIVAGLFATGVWKLTGELACKPIFCNEYHFICCIEEPETSGYKTIQYGLSIPQSNLFFQCPTYATKCEVIGNGQFYHGSTSCGVGFLNVFSCSNGISRSPNTVYTMLPGEYAYIVSSTSVRIDYTTFHLTLLDTGAAGSGVGIEVPSATGCTFVTNDAIYNDDGTLARSPTQTEQSYTVPKGRCMLYTTHALQRQCDSTCNICSQNSECAVGHQFQEGGYGIECVDYQKQYYGCKTEKICTEKNIVNGVEKCITEETLGRCGLIKSEPVGCCPGSATCGTNAFCDPATWTCKATAECTNNWDCGTQTVCDRPTKTLRTPVCSGGKCTYQDQPVECCFDSDCADNWDCIMHVCKEAPEEKISCPFSCCVDELKYFDKPCDPRYPVCCPNHECKATQAECEGGGGHSDADFVLLMVALMLLFGLIGGALGYLFKGLVGAIILALMGLLIGFLIAVVVIPIIQQMLDILKVSVDIIDALIFWD